jgi:hypothetical protein
MIMCTCMCLILQYITIYTTTNQVKMKATNIYDGVVMIFLNDPLIILLWETWEKNWRQRCLEILDRLLHIWITHCKELRKVMGVWGSHVAHYYYWWWRWCFDTLWATLIRLWLHYEFSSLVFKVLWSFLMQSHRYIVL